MTIRDELSMPYSEDDDFAVFINEHCVGKTIARAESIDTHTPVHAVKIYFADGTVIKISGKYDEGFIGEIATP